MAEQLIDTIRARNPVSSEQNHWIGTAKPTSMCKFFIEGDICAIFKFNFALPENRKNYGRQ